MARTLDDFYRETLWRTSLNTTDLPYIYTAGGAYGFLQLFHDVYTKLIREIVSTGCDFFMEKSTFNLVADQQEYIMPADLMKFRQIELNYNGGGWARATDIDLSHLPNSSEAATLSSASVYHPLFDILEDSFFIYPEATTNQVSGGKLWYIKMPAEGLYISAISAASATVTFPPEYEWLLPLGCAVEVWGKYRLINENAVEFQRYNQGVADMKRQMKPRVEGGQKRVIDFREIT